MLQPPDLIMSNFSSLFIENNFLQKLENKRQSRGGKMRQSVHGLKATERHPEKIKIAIDTSLFIPE